MKSTVSSTAGPQKGEGRGVLVQSMVAQVRVQLPLTVHHSLALQQLVVDQLLHEKKSVDKVN